MDTVLDKYGKQVEVEGVWFPAEMWVISLVSDDIPVACLAVDINTGTQIGWEEYKGLLDIIHSHKEGDKELWEENGKQFRLTYYKADFSAVMSGSIVIASSAWKVDGQMVGGWTNPDFRGSITLWAWAACFTAHLLNNKDYDRLYCVTGVNNIAANKYHTKIGGKLIGTVKVNAELFNRYEWSINGIKEQSNKLRYILCRDNLDDVEGKLKEYLHSQRLTNVG